MGVLDLLLPPACAGCGRYGRILCPDCHRSLERASDERDRFIGPDPGVVVGDALDVAVAAFRYGGPLRRALAGLKYGGSARVAGPLAAAAAPVLSVFTVLAPGATLVPVPVHADRLRQRGYNQAALLAAGLARHARLPLGELLVRRRPTTQQHRLDRTARLRNLREAFALHPGRDPPRAAILVDDILTTSATLEACAAVLRAAGSECVLGFAIAREI
jgi:ComF family protein